MIVEKTRLSEQYFSGLQKFVVLELGLTLLPVSTSAEAAQLIAQLVSQFSITASVYFCICIASLCIDFFLVSSCVISRIVYHQLVVIC